MVAAAAIIGCRGTRGDPVDAAASATATASARASADARAPKDGVAAWQETAFAEAERALTAWSGCEAGAAYGELRRSLAAAEPLARPSARMAAEALFGPPRPSEEGAGALAAVDRALAAKDCGAVDKGRFQIRSALTLARGDPAGANKITPARAAQAATDAAYELGLALLDARVSVSHFDEGQRGDVVGLADAVLALAAVIEAPPSGDLERAVADARAIRAAVVEAPSMAKLEGRARMARATGAIGLALRRAARARGSTVRPPYRIAADAEDTGPSPLTLPPPRTPADAALVALGRRLFEDRRLSANGHRACASCHDAAHGYADARATPASLDPTAPLKRNTPTLLYDGLAATQLWDGKIVTAEVQALRVVHNKAELGVTDDTLVALVKGDAAYAAAFAAIGPDEVTPAAIGRALGAYVASLGSGTSPLDAYAHGDDHALTPDVARGLDVFIAGRCARCHVPPLWGGSRPTDFAVPVYGVLGVPASPGGSRLDDDIGRAGVTHRERDRGAFKTPTVRDVARTAPYMHHGMLATLEQVVDFYDKGGGRGGGLDVPNQDPDVVPLKLSAEDRRVLLVFLREGLLDAK